MSSPPDAVLVVLAALIAAGALAVGLVAERQTSWKPAGGLILIAATPLVPHVPVALGLSLDDILPVLGTALLLRAVDLGRVIRLRASALLVVGLMFLIGAALLSTVVHAEGISSAVVMAGRSAARYAFLAMIGLAAVLAVPAPRRRSLVAVSVATVGVIEALFGLFAFAVPAIGIGLEPTKSYSVLYFEVPGRIAGTLGISPNFLGAIFIMTILLTAGLALDARTNRHRLGLWALVGAQTLALVLTFTRASLGLAVVGLIGLILVRGGFRYLLPVALAVVVGFTLTPAAERLTGDVPDRFALWASAAAMMADNPFAGVGPGQSIAVARANPDRYMATAFGGATNTAHNTVLFAGAETGVLGALGSLLVNLALAIAAVRVVVRGRHRRRPAIEAAAAIAVLGYLAQGAVNNLFNVAASGAVFALVVGAFVLPALVRPRQRPVTAIEPRSVPSSS